MLQSTNTFSVALRNLTKDARNVEGRLQRKSIIHQYSNFDSQVYAPMTRIGVYLDSNSEQYNVKSKLTTSLNGQPHKDNVMCILMLSIISSIMYYPPPLPHVPHYYTFRFARTGGNFTTPGSAPQV